MSSYTSTETEAVITEPTQVSPGFLYTYYEYVNGWASETHVSFLGSFVFILVCLAKIQYNGFRFIFYFDMLYYFSEACSFLMKDRKRTDPDEREGVCERELRE